MRHIVGFRKIISFKMGIKNIPSFLKNKVDYHLTLNYFLEKKSLCCIYSALKVIYSSFCFI
jgi:hypothetical protein